MSWQKEWKAIEVKIAELTTICNEHVAALAVVRSDSYGTVNKIILPMAKEISRDISIFGQRYQSQLPGGALQLLGTFTESQAFILAFTSSDATVKLPATVAHISGLLRKFRADFNYLTFDLEGVVVRQTARAFSHLQRSIVADVDVRRKWATAYGRNEAACEQLGAVHLLSHGIWCFKAHSVGERTDLVLGEPLRNEDLSEVYLAAEGLVLTEWKVSSGGDAEKKFQDAMNQASLYGSGSLAPIELKAYRYLVVVSEKAVRVPDDIESGGIVYKHINIAVNPDTPSRAARGSK